LSTIATLFGGTVENLLVANELAAGEFIQPGDTLILPILGAPPEALAVTPEASVSATAAPESAPTAVIYVAPRLLAPEEGAEIARSEPVPFQWESVDLLASNEWYVLQLLPRNLTARTLPTTWTKQTSYRLEPSLAPEEGQVADYAWLVSVVRVRRNAEGRVFLEAASPTSSVRTFSWK
jgi:hypothetical protein